MNNNIIHLEASSKKNIKYIYHLADIHIKNDQSTKNAYDIVFKRLYDKIRSYGNLDESLIVICGDIFDNKTNIKPEAISMIKDFFYNLCTITDCVVILGNHEKPSSNKEALDVLTPIITQNFYTINKLYLLKDKYYSYNNILFGVTNLYDIETTKFDFPTDKIKIALYHGYIHGAKLEKGNEEYVVGLFNLGDFSTADYLLLGDIHKFQYLNKEKTAAYPSSLLQLSFGENIHDHGFIRWNISDKSSEYVRIPGDYCYLTIRVDNGKISNLDDENNIPNNVNIKFIWNNTCRDRKKEIIDLYRNKYNIIEMREINDIESIKYSDNNNKKIDIANKLKNITNIRTLIHNYIDKKTFSVELKHQMKDEINKILHDIELNDNNKQMNIKIESIKFNNLYVYGKNNIIDFTKLKKITGLLAPNKYGKSSIIEILIQSIWGTNTKGVNNNEIINNTTNDYETKVILTCNGIKYMIIRYGKLIVSKVKEEVSLFTFDDDNRINISKDSKNETEQEIVKIFGNYHDYLKTCIMTQNHPYNFVDMKQTEKKEFLNKLFRFDILRNISKKASYIRNQLTSSINTNKKNVDNFNETITNKKIKKYNKKVKSYGKKIKKNNKIIQEIRNSITINKYECNKLKDYLEKNINKKELLTKLNNKKQILNSINNDLDYNNNILRNKLNILDKINENLLEYYDFKEDYESYLEEKNRLVNLVKNINNTKYNIINHYNIKKIKYNIKIVNNNKSELKREKRNIKGEINNMKKQMITLFKDFDLNDIKIYEDSINNRELLESNILTKTKELNNYTRILDDLKNYKYNEKCSVCMNNQITKKKISIENTVYKLNEELSNLNNELNKHNSVINNYSNIYHRYQKDKDNKEKNKKLSINIDRLENKLIIINEKIKLCDQELDILFGQKNEYNKNKQFISYNKDANNEIHDINEEIDKITTILDNYQNQLVKLENDKIIIGNDIIEIRNKINVLIRKKEKKESDIQLLNNEIEKYKNYDQIFSSYHKLERKIKNDDNKIYDLNNKNTKLTNKLEKYKQNIYKLENERKIMTKIIKNINEAEKERDIYNNIITVFNKGGINDDILKNMIIPSLESTVNNILSSIEDYNIKIVYDNTNFKIYKKKKGKMNNIVLNSGHERGIDNIVFRLSFCYLNNYIKTNFFIIDEGFKHTDEEHKDNLKSLFEYIRNSFDWCLITTHDDYVKNNFDMQINIDKKNGKSFIKN